MGSRILVSGGGSSPGQIAYFASLPEGWLVANGATISRTDYADLFAAISTTFGSGDGSTTFRLPDLRGEFIRCADNGRGIDTGRGIGSTQGDQFRSHSHGSYKSGNSGGTNVFHSYYGGYTNGATTKSAGGNETRPRNVALLACIKY